MPDFPDWHWILTVGGPTDDDPRNGALHQALGREPRPRHDIEDWWNETDDAPVYARFWRNPAEPPADHEDGHPIWTYHYYPRGEQPAWAE
jgi:hypothetical protein